MRATATLAAPTSRRSVVDAADKATQRMPHLTTSAAARLAARGPIARRSLHVVKVDDFLTRTVHVHDARQILGDAL